MALWQWSPTPANNATAVTNVNWQEGQAPSTVNDSARQMMADVATQFQNGWEWLNFGDTPTYVSTTQFTVPGNLTARYTVGRRVKAKVSAGTIYGTISASAYTSLTTVTVTWDGTSVLDSGVSEVDVGIMDPAHSSLPALSSLSVSGTTQTPVTFSTTNSSGYQKMSCSGGAKYLGVVGNSFVVVNQANTAVLLTIDDSGNLTSTGGIQANSDERLKTDWTELPSDFIEQLAGVRSGTYSRIDIDQRQAGVGAQSLRSVLPEAVHESEKGILSVAYGQAALVACVELAKEVIRLRALLEPAA